VEPDHYNGWFLGSHVFKTKYGEIRVSPIVRVRMFRDEFDILPDGSTFYEY
jgi:hypothetical protein